MKLSFRTTTAPTMEPVTLAEAKLHLRVDIPDDDVLISRLIKTAREFVEGQTERRFVNSTVLFTGNGFPTYGECGCDDEIPGWNGYIPQSIRASSSRIELPLLPVVSLASVKYTSELGVDTTIAANQYTLNAPDPDKPAWVEPIYDVYWPTARVGSGALRISAVVGYGTTPATTPEMARQAILLLLGSWYEHREEFVTGTVPARIPTGAESLIRLLKWRVF